MVLCALDRDSWVGVEGLIQVHGELGDFVYSRLEFELTPGLNYEGLFSLNAG